MTSWHDPLGTWDGHDGDDGPGVRGPAAGSSSRRPAAGPVPAAGGRVPAAVAMLEAVAGALSIGLLALGVALALAQVMAPSLWPGPGLAAGTGPGWGRVILHLVVGAGGEAIRFARRWSGGAVRALLASATILASLVTMWIAWWN